MAYCYELIYMIVPYGRGSKIIHAARELGVTGGTVFLGKGTIQNTILRFFGLDDERKEIVMMATDSLTAERIIEPIYEKFHFERPNQGIIFTIGVGKIIGSRPCHNKFEDIVQIGEKKMYQAIFTIVNRGFAEDVVEAAQKAGSRGGTIINARGSGINETSKVFNMEIEPEKEMVMILSKSDVTENIVESIRKALEIDKPGNGIIFVQDVHKVYGIYEK